MLKALLWKEWRQYRVNIIGLLLVLLGYFLLKWSFHHFVYIRLFDEEITREYWVNYDNGFRVGGFYCLCGLIAISMGSLFTEEQSKKTFQFLFIHPLTRTEIWRAKIYTGVFVIILTFLFTLILHRLLGAWWVWSEPRIVPIFPYAIYVVICGYALGLFSGVVSENSTTAVITAILGVVLLYFGLSYYGKLDWRYVVPLFLPVAVIFITVSHIVFCYPDYWHKPLRKVWYKKIGWVAIPLFFLSWIPFLVEK